MFGVAVWSIAIIFLTHLVTAAVLPRDYDDGIGFPFSPVLLLAIFSATFALFRTRSTNPGFIHASLQLRLEVSSYFSCNYHICRSVFLFDISAIEKFCVIFANFVYNRKY
jgi:hypothetical protein